LVSAAFETADFSAGLDSAVLDPAGFDSTGFGSTGLDSGGFAEDGAEEDGAVVVPPGFGAPAVVPGVAAVDPALPAGLAGPLPDELEAHPAAPSAAAATRTTIPHCPFMSLPSRRLYLARGTKSLPGLRE
jgi:hypothetical protein